MMMARTKGPDPATLAAHNVTAQGTAETGYTLTCGTCGATWPAQPTAGGRLPVGYWRCPRGCNAQPTPAAARSAEAAGPVLELGQLPAVLTPAEAAQLLRVSELTVKAWARAGDLPGAFKLGKEWRVERDALLAHIRGRA